MKPIFVFGSNLAGIHGAGSAKEAHLKHGAEIGVGAGRTGDAYAIPTKGHDLKSLRLPAIHGHVLNFLSYARQHPQLTFNVIKIGCGLAGFKEWQIAPMFRNASDNVNLPEGWRTFPLAMGQRTGD